MNLSNPSLVNNRAQHASYEDKQTFIRLDIVARMNNLGVASIENGDNEQAGHFLRRALEKASEATFFKVPVTQPPVVKGTEVSRSLYVYQRGEYDEGMHTFAVPLMLDASRSTVPKAIATVLFNLGQLYLRLNELEGSSTSFLHALQMAQMNGAMSSGPAKEQSVSPTDVSVMAILHNIGHVQYRMGNYEEAVRTYAKALQLGKHSYNKNTHEVLEVAATLNCLGVLYFHLPKAETEKAMELYMESLGIHRSVLGVNCESKEVATTLNNIGRVHYMRGEHEQALQLYQDALRMRRRLLGDEHLDVGATVYNAGQTYHQMGCLNEAMTLYKEFLVIARKRLGVYHRDVAIMLKCMAQIHHEEKDYDKGAELYQEALVVGKAALGNYHPEVASTLNKLGNLYYERGDFENALKVYKEGLEVERAVLDVFHPNVVVTLTNIGQIYKLKGEFSAALRVYKEAVAIQRHSLGASHPNIAVTLSSIALIHYQSRSFSKSLEIYQEALRIRRDHFGDENLEVASNL